MAQRREIRCAERQFALQSGRLTKLRKFQNRRHCAEGTHKRLPLFVFRFGLPKASLETQREAFIFLNCVWSLRGTRNEGKPDPCEVRINRA